MMHDTRSCVASYGLRVAVFRHALCAMRISMRISFAILLTLLLTSSVTAEQWVKVKWVDDGDTILLANGRHLRYIGINSPEIENKKYERQAEPYGHEALSYNRHLVFNEIFNHHT